MRRPLSRFPHFSVPDSDAFSRVTHPYNTDAFELLLDKHGLTRHYPNLCINLRNGFPLGLMPDLQQTVVFPNHPSCFAHSSAVDHYLAEEVSAGRMSGPFPKSDVERILRGPFQASPLIVAVQTQQPGTPDKLRICRHLSKGSKIHPSVNSYIDKEDFPTRFDTAARVADIIALAPPGTQACTLDIEKFHRTCPVNPNHKPFLVVQGRTGDFYIDHDHPFGAASASSNSGMIANAVVDIWRGEKVFPVLKYEDDLKAFRFPSPLGVYLDGPYSYDYDREEMLRRVAPLQVPWHQEKGDKVFVFVTTFIGFLWDIPRKLVSLPEEKRLKFRERVRVFIESFSGHRCILNDVDKIHGSLCHVAFVYTDGRSHLPSISNFAASFGGNELQSRYPPHSMMTDLRWWLSTLSVPGYTRELHPRGPQMDLGISVDASTSWGIGVIINGQWAAFQLSNSWKEKGRDICWLETLAIEFLIYFLIALGYRDTCILIRSDNMGAMGAHTKGRCPNWHINMSVRRAYSSLSTSNIIPSFEYIESKNNPADPISRGILGRQEDHIPIPIMLPEELRSAFINV